MTDIIEQGAHVQNLTHRHLLYNGHDLILYLVGAISVEGLPAHGQRGAIGIKCSQLTAILDWRQQLDRFGYNHDSYSLPLLLLYYYNVLRQ